MTATPFNIAAMLDSAPSGGEKPALSPGAKAGAIAGGPAFLAILDQWIKSSASGLPPKGADHSRVGPGDPPPDSPFGKSISFDAHRFADVLDMGSFAKNANGVSPEVVSHLSAPTQPAATVPLSDIAGNQATGSDLLGTAPRPDHPPGHSANTDLGVLLAQTYNPEIPTGAGTGQPTADHNGRPAAEHYVATTGQPALADTTAGDETTSIATRLESAVGSGIDERIASRGKPAPADGADVPEPTGAPVTAARSTGQSSAIGPAGAGTDRALDTVLATFARNIQTSPQPGQLSALQGPATNTAAAAVPAQMAQTDPDARQTRPNQPDAGTIRAGRTGHGTEDKTGSAGKKEIDPLKRLMSAGQNNPARPGSANGSAGPTPDPLVTPAGSQNHSGFSQTLTAVNEIGGPTSAVQPGGHAAAQTSATGASDTAPRPNVEALAVRITHEAARGNHRFEIALDPPDLGRVDVRLEFNRDGRVTTHLLVDRSDTLDALMRDSRGLERALQSQGLKLDDGGVQYHLRDQSSFAHHQGERETPDSASADGAPDDTEVASPLEETPVRRRVALGGLDLTI